METIRKIMAAMEAMDEWAGGHTRNHRSRSKRR